MKKFYSIIDRDSSSGYSVQYILANNKNDAENAIWDTDDMASYRGIYTGAELKQVLDEVGKKLQLYGNTKSYGLLSILSPKVGDDVWVPLSEEDLKRNDFSAPEGMWDYFNHAEIINVLNSTKDRIKLFAKADGLDSNNHETESMYTLPFKLLTEKGQLLCSGEYYNTYFEDQNVDMWNDGVRDLKVVGPLSENILKEMMPNAFAGNYILPQDEGFDLNRKEVSFVVSFAQLQAIVNGADPENIGSELKMLSEIQKIALTANSNMDLSDAAAAVKPKQSSPQIQ